MCGVLVHGREMDLAGRDSYGGGRGRGRLLSWERFTHTRGEGGEGGKGGGREGREGGGREGPWEDVGIHPAGKQLF